MCNIRQSKTLYIIYLKLTDYIILLFHCNHQRAWNQFLVLIIELQTNCRCSPCWTSIWPNLILILLRSLMKQSKFYISIYSNAYQDATDFEACKLIKHTKNQLSSKLKIILSSNKKNHL